MNFNTAIVIDTENLTKGSQPNPNIRNNLSLKNIINQIHENLTTDRIATVRAYGDWSNLKLNFLEYEMQKLGIEPVQLFGFSRDATKNEADIALTVDTMDLVHKRPHIRKICIVSGDGGFSYLANKLHE